MKKSISAALIAVVGIMLLLPSIGYSNPMWKHDRYQPHYVVVREQNPHYYRPEPVRHHEEMRYVPQRHASYNGRHDDDRSGQVAIAAIGGIVVGTLLGTVIANGR